MSAMAAPGSVSNGKTTREGDKAGGEVGLKGCRSRTCHRGQDQEE